MKSFKVLEKVKKKETKRLETSLLNDNPAAYMHSTRDFTYVPGEAFDTISMHEDFEYLQKGLWVGDKLLDANKDIQELCLNLGYKTHEYNGNIAYVPWDHAKKITNNLEAIMMTPPMFMSVMDHLVNTSQLTPLYFNMMDSDSEWLDAVINRKEGLLKINPEVVPHGIIDPFNKKTRNGQFTNYDYIKNKLDQDIYSFCREDISPLSAFPIIIDEDISSGDMILEMNSTSTFYHLDMGVCKGRHAVGNELKIKIACDEPIAFAGKYHSMRICYKVK